MIAITCNVATPWLERRIQMRIDHHRLFRPITKASFGLRRGSVAAPLAEAIALSMVEPPGPVHLDLPEDVSLADAVEEPLSVQIESALPDRSDDAIRELAAALMRSRYPLLVTGLTFTRSKTGAALLRFIERQGFRSSPRLTLRDFCRRAIPTGWVCWVGRDARMCSNSLPAATWSSRLARPDRSHYEEWVGATPVFHLSTEAADTGPNLALRFNEPLDLDPAIADGLDVCRAQCLVGVGTGRNTARLLSVRFALTARAGPA